MRGGIYRRGRATASLEAVNSRIFGERRNAETSRLVCGEVLRESVKMEDAAAKSDINSCGSVWHVELAQDAAHVRLDGFL